MSKRIQLFWWSERKLMSKSKENYGDLLGKYLVDKISGKEVVWVHPKKQWLKTLYKPVFFTIGSILTHVNEKCVVWGSGIISKEYPVKKAKFLAVRGPQTRKHLMGLGYDVPKIYGDPALLLPNYYVPKIDKKFKYGIVPHYTDYDIIADLYKDRKNLLIIDLMTNDIEAVTDLFLSCDKIVSSSLHGVIIAHTYGIPAIWQQFSNRVFGDNIKYRDYFESVEIPSYSIDIKDTVFSNEELETLFKEYPSLPDMEVIEKLKRGLLKVCPFTKN